VRGRCRGLSHVIVKHMGIELIYVETASLWLLCGIDLVLEKLVVYTWKMYVFDV